MKPSIKLALISLALVLTLSSAPVSALPSCCHMLCYYPNTCYHDCLVVDGQDEYWTTCYAYFGNSCSAIDP